MHSNNTHNKKNPKKNSRTPIRPIHQRNNFGEIKTYANSIPWSPSECCMRSNVWELSWGFCIRHRTACCLHPRECTPWKSPQTSSSPTQSRIQFLPRVYGSWERYIHVYKAGLEYIIASIWYQRLLLHYIWLLPPQFLRLFILFFPPDDGGGPEIQLSGIFISDSTTELPYNVNSVSFLENNVAFPLKIF